MERLIIVSCDGHAGAPVAEYGKYLDPKYRPLMPELAEAEKKHLGMLEMLSLVSDPGRLATIDPRGRIEGGAYNGGWDAAQRLRELDAEGIGAEVVLPGTAQAITPFFYQFNSAYPGDVRWAGARAYHRWLAEVMIAPAKGRLLGLADAGPCEDMDATIAELRFVAERGFRAVFVPGFIRNAALPPLFDRHFDPFWAACIDLGLVPMLHAGWGDNQGDFAKLLDESAAVRKKLDEEGDASKTFDEAFAKLNLMMDENNPDSVFALDIAPRQAVWQMIFGGVFDRFPKLKIVVAECRADWQPALKAHLDERYLAAERRPQLKMKPSEYFGRNIFNAPSSPRRVEVEARHEIGLDSFMFGADFPHPEGTWPNTLTWLQAVFYDLPEAELRAILADNAIGVFGLDREWLAGIAAKIGFLPSDIIGDHPVDKRVIADFDVRSSFSNTTPPIDQRTLETKVDSDLAATAA